MITSIETGSRIQKRELRAPGLMPSLMMLRYTYWGAGIAGNPPSVHYDEIMADDKGVGKWTDKIVRQPSTSNF
jgi:trimethyllysine dioxygenase